MEMDKPKIKIFGNLFPILDSLHARCYNVGKEQV